MAPKGPAAHLLPRLIVQEASEAVMTSPPPSAPGHEAGAIRALEGLPLPTFVRTQPKQRKPVMALLDAISEVKVRRQPVAPVGQPAAQPPLPPCGERAALHAARGSPRNAARPFLPAPRTLRPAHAPVLTRVSSWR
jgi:hypothetical protein